MNRLVVFSVGTNLINFGGAQKVMVDVHNGIKEEFEAKVLGFGLFAKIHPAYMMDSSEYIRLINPLLLKNSTVLIHARSLTTLFFFLNHIFRLNLKVVYVSHNLYEDKRFFTFLPATVVSISEKVTENLRNYFRVSSERIVKIPNGIVDCAPSMSSTLDKNQVVILYSARVNSVKRQVDLVKNLKDKINSNIKIIFAGTGPDFVELVSVIGDSENFEAHGFTDDISTLIDQSHYCLLFSRKEGLPISLMEGARAGKPLIVNDVGGNLEIGLVGKNALRADTWAELIRTLNNLPDVFSETYDIMSLNSRKIYESNFRYENMIKKYTSLIKSLNKNEPTCY